MPFFSIQLNSNRPKQIVEFFDNIEATADRPEDIEVLLHIDAGDKAMEEVVAREKTIRRFDLRVLQTDLVKDYATLWKPLNPLFEMTHPDVYFVANLFDELHFETRGWDTIIRQYEGYYPDHIFRLRCSKYCFRNYKDFWECGYAPDSMAFYTRRWLELSGDWNPCLGPDSFQQSVAFHMFTSPYFSSVQYNRDIPIPDIKFSGEGAAVGLTGEALSKRLCINNRAWYVLMSHAMQQEANRRAMRMVSHMIAYENGGDQAVVVEEKKAERCFVVRQRESDEEIIVISYALSWWKTSFINLLRTPFMLYYSGGGAEYWREHKLTSVLLVICSRIPYGAKIFTFISHVRNTVKKWGASIRRRLKHLWQTTRRHGKATWVYSCDTLIQLKNKMRQELIQLYQAYPVISSVLFSLSKYVLSRLERVYNKVRPIFVRGYQRIAPSVSRRFRNFIKTIHPVVVIRIINPYESHPSLMKTNPVFISIGVSASDPEKITAFIDSLEKTALRPERIEVIVSTDKSDAINAVLEEQSAIRKIKIRRISSLNANHGNTSWKIRNEFFAHAASTSYFLAYLDEGLKFETSGWDDELEKLTGYYADHYFRVRCSENRFRNYRELKECAITPDTATFYTRRYLAAQDNLTNMLDHNVFQQYVAFYIYSSNPFCHTQYHRDIVLSHVRFSGGANIRISQVKPQDMTEAKRNAMLIKANIIAEDNAVYHNNQVIITENKRAKNFTIKRKDNFTKFIVTLPYKAS